MFIKIVVVLLLFIVAASLLAGGRAAPRGSGPAAPARLRPLMMKMALALLVLGGVLAVAHLSACAPRDNSFHSRDITGTDAGNLALLEGFVDHRGRRLASADFLPGGRFAGQAVVLFFGYTRCPDICPTTLATLQAAMQLLAANAGRVQVLFVSVDPERDTPELLAAFVPWFDERFLGLSADAERVRTAARAFKVFYAKVKGDSEIGYSIDHTASSYAFDPHGRLRLLIGHDASAQQIAEDLNRLLAGQ